MNIATRIRKLSQEFRNTINNKSRCDCSQPFEFVTITKDIAEIKDKYCPYCGGRKIIILVDKDDSKA